MTSQAPAVSMQGITKRFPGVVANDHVDFEAAAGEVHALLGENGAGKTTLSHILTGLYRAGRGRRSPSTASGSPSPRRARRSTPASGWSTSSSASSRGSPSRRTSCSATAAARAASFRIDPGAVDTQVRELGERYSLGVDPHARIWQLSVGEQQRVEILKALYQEARVLILDEPTAVLTPRRGRLPLRHAAPDRRARGGRSSSSRTSCTR